MTIEENQAIADGVAHDFGDRDAHCNCLDEALRASRAREAETMKNMQDTNQSYADIANAERLRAEAAEAKVAEMTAEVERYKSLWELETSRAKAAESEAWERGRRMVAAEAKAARLVGMLDLAQRIVDSVDQDAIYDLGVLQALRADLRILADDVPPGGSVTDV